MRRRSAPRPRIPIAGATWSGARSTGVTRSGEKRERASPARDREAQQFVLRQLPAWIENQGLLVVEVGLGLVVQALIGNGAVVVGLGRFVQSEAEGLVDVREGFLVAPFADEH